MRGAWYIMYANFSGRGHTHMYKSLKKFSLRSVLPRVIALALCAVILLAVTGFGIFRLLSPVDADGTISGGDYVRFDLSQVVVAFATSSGTFSGEHTYYILDLGDGNFAALKAASNDASAFAVALTQSQSYYHDGTLDELNTLGYAYGTAVKMDSSTLSLLEEGLESAELEGNIVATVVNYGRLGTTPKNATVALTCLALVFIVLAAIPLIAALSGAYQKEVRASLSGEDAEEEYSAAFTRDQTRVGARHFWYQKGAKSLCIPTNDIIWGFNRLDSRMLGSRRYSLELYLRSGENLDIRTKTEQERDEIASAISENAEVFVHGYSQERAAAYAHSREGFIAKAKTGEI
jgi:hypothetical protein